MMSAEISTDVCIIGGGPGRLCNGACNWQAGIERAILEKSTFPRDKVCGDALSGKVMRTLERLDASWRGR
jgi:2-polyprenyl-6-methoxyphenol hydroxylase-like FAD-dependent oxidoreductase